MNRKERRKHNALMRKYPKNLTPVPEEEWPKADDPAIKRIAVWRSRDYLVQLFEEPEAMLRLSMCRTTVGANGRWQDGLSWEEMQGIKHIVGFAKGWAVEIFPPAEHVVNVANMRHLWLLPEGVDLKFGWRR